MRNKLLNFLLTGSLLFSPVIGQTVSDVINNHEKEKVSKTLDKTILKYDLPNINTNYGNHSEFVYNASVWGLPIGKITSNKDTLKIDLGIFQQSIFYDSTETIHAQITGNEKYIYENLFEDLWKIEKYMGKDKEKRKLEGGLVHGDPITKLITKKFSGEKIEEVSTFVSGITYKGMIPAEKNYLGYNRLDLNFENFKNYENGTWDFVSNDEDVIIGNISGLSQNDVAFLVTLRHYIKFLDFNVPLNFTFVREDLKEKTP